MSWLKEINNAFKHKLISIKDYSHFPFILKKKENDNHINAWQRLN